MNVEKASHIAAIVSAILSIVSFGSSMFGGGGTPNVHNTSDTFDKLLNMLEVYRIHLLFSLLLFLAISLFLKVRESNNRVAQLSKAVVAHHALIHKHRDCHYFLRKKYHQVLEDFGNCDNQDILQSIEARFSEDSYIIAKTAAFKTATILKQLIEGDFLNRGITEQVNVTILLILPANREKADASRLISSSDKSDAEQSEVIRFSSDAEVEKSVESHVRGGGGNDEPGLLSTSTALQTILDKDIWFIRNDIEGCKSTEKHYSCLPSFAEEDKLRANAKMVVPICFRDSNKNIEWPIGFVCIMSKNLSKNRKLFTNTSEQSAYNHIGSCVDSLATVFLYEHQYGEKLAKEYGNRYRAITGFRRSTDRGLKPPPIATT